ncbi:MAG: substrate-binding domain-containing protein [Bermanella sp.]
MNLHIKKLLVISILSFMASSAFAECIGVITAGGGKGFWGDISNGAKQAGKELGITIYARGASDEANKKGQQQAINSIMENGCGGLVLAPNAKDRNKDVAKLKQKGIPTVYIDRDLGGDRVSVIKTNNFAAGEMAGKEMVKALKGKGRVALLRLSKDVVSTTARENGFMKAAIAGGLEIAVDKFLGTTIGNARSHAEKALTNTSGIQGIFTPNESTSTGVLLTLEKLNKQGSLVHIGFDSSPVMIDSLNNHHIYGFVVQRPFKMGYDGVHTVYKAMKGTSIKEDIDTGVVFVNRTNIKQVKIKEMLGI